MPVMATAAHLNGRQGLGGCINRGAREIDASCRRSEATGSPVGWPWSELTSQEGGFGSRDLPATRSKERWHLRGPLDPAGKWTEPAGPVLAVLVRVVERSFNLAPY